MFQVTYTCKPAPSATKDRTTSPRTRCMTPAARASADSVRQWRSTLHAGFCGENETKVIQGAPLELRLLGLLTEGRRYELQRAAGSPTRQTWVKKAYMNLATDVRARCRLIRDNEQSDDVHKHSIGTEAINCYASMLPWSDSVVSAESKLVPVPRVPAATTAADGTPMQPPSFFSGQAGGMFAPVGGFAAAAGTPQGMLQQPTVRVGVQAAAATTVRVGTKTPQQAQPPVPRAAAAAAPSPGALLPPPMFHRKKAFPAASAAAMTMMPTTVWRIPERLAADNGKLAAAANSRVARLPRSCRLVHSSSATVAAAAR